MIMITREFLSDLEFRPMTKFERMGFAGCESPVPMIAEIGDKYLVVIDGDYCEITDVDEQDIVGRCENIRELDY